MSYAAVAASGPKQSAEEVEHTEDSVSSLVDVDSPHISSVPSDYESQSVKTDTQAERLEREQEIKQTAKEIKQTTKDIKQTAKEIKTDTQAERLEREQEIRQTAKEIKHKAAVRKEAAKEAVKEKAEAAKEKAESAKEKVKKNADNPVVISNAVGLAVIGAFLSFGAYRKHSHGELTGKVVAAWAGVLGLFGVGDYFVSQYFFKRFPPKN